MYQTYDWKAIAGDRTPAEIVADAKAQGVTLSQWLVVSMVDAIQHGAVFPNVMQTLNQLHFHITSQTQEGPF